MSAAVVVCIAEPLLLADVVLVVVVVLILVVDADSRLAAPWC